MSPVTDDNALAVDALSTLAVTVDVHLSYAKQGLPKRGNNSDHPLWRHI